MEYFKQEFRVIFSFQFFFCRALSLVLLVHVCELNLKLYLLKGTITVQCSMLIQCILLLFVCFFFHSPLWKRMTSRRLFISVITFYVLCVAERHCFVLVEFTFLVSIDLYLLHGLFTCSHTHKQKTERSAQIMAKCSIVFTRYNIDIDGIFLYLVLLLLVLLVVVLLFFPILTIDTRFFFYRSMHFVLRERLVN